ncbi:MAG: ATP-binding protein, partial [Bacteroidales bacterium]|nr:ATP-binding protein [Bacteroidales bacterium]
MIIGRENEQKQLEQLYESEYSEFVAIYGRRRVGKTFLVRETFNYRFAFQHTGIQGGDKKRQLIEFAQSLHNA